MNTFQAFYRYLWRTIIVPSSCPYSSSILRQTRQASKKRMIAGLIRHQYNLRGFTSTSKALAERPLSAQPVSQSSVPPQPNPASPALRENSPVLDRREAAKSAIQTLLGFTGPINSKGRQRTDTLTERSSTDGASAFNLADIVPSKQNLYDSMNSYEGPSRSSRDVSKSALEALMMSEPSKAPESAFNLRLKPTLGRTVAVDTIRGIDVTRAIRILESKCNQNKVRADERAQRIYVRRGQRVKILRSQRWRELFKKGFLEECARIRRMKAQGW